MSAHSSDTAHEKKASVRTQASRYEIETLTKRFVHQLTMGLIFFSVAWFFLTVGVFTFNPIGPIGLTSLSIGLLCLLTSIIYIIRYALTSNKVQKLL
jgi:uncharacterized RDD family membrane protein YckC